jgi:hypothetical protein
MFDRELLENRFEIAEGELEIAFKNYERARKRKRALAMHLNLTRGQAAHRMLSELSWRLSIRKRQNF